MVTKKKKLKTTRNKFEHRLFTSLKSKGVGATYETERIPYVLAGFYLPDFVIPTKSGKIYVEAKGYFRPEAKRKMIAVKKQNPNKDIRIVLYSANPKYIKWCIKHQFKYAVGDIPDEWLQE